MVCLAVAFNEELIVQLFGKREEPEPEALKSCAKRWSSWHSAGTSALSR